MIGALAAAAGGVAVMLAAKGGVRPPASETAARPVGVCLFQIRGQMQYVNLYAIESVSVREVGACGYCAQKQYETEIVASRRVYRIEMPRGEHISTHVNAINERIAACGRGE